jgi:sulfatase modifying factor 1
VRAGLALDVLRQFLTLDLTAGSRPWEYLYRECYPHVPDFPALITALKDKFLLTEDAAEASHNTRLAHDALAPVVHQRCQSSQRPAQLARAIVEIKCRHLDGEADFSAGDVRLVEAGRPYMERIPDALQARLESSRQALERRNAELRDKTALIFDTLANDAHLLVDTVEHGSALEKIKAAMAVDVPEQTRRERLELLIIETAFFLSATGKHAGQVREALALLASFAYPEKQTAALQNLFRLLPRGHSAFQTLLPAGTFADLERRYFPQTVPVEGGTFTMGSTRGYADEQPLHEVALPDFRMSIVPVTFAQFGLYCAATGRHIASYAPSWGKWADHPLVNVMWYEAVEYANWLSTHLGLQPAYRVDKNQKDPNNQQANDIFKWLVERVPEANGFRLPTEVEWEYAARGGRQHWNDGSLYAGGNDVDTLAWYWKNSGDKPLDGEWDYEQVMLHNCRTHPVGQKQPNALGLYDMSGNVWEWCWDWFDGKYYAACEQNGLVSDPRGPEKGDHRVNRGGSWFYGARSCRAACRIHYAPAGRNRGVGFRLVGPSQSVGLPDPAFL